MFPSSNRTSKIMKISNCLLLAYPLSAAVDGDGLSQLMKTKN